MSDRICWYCGAPATIVRHDYSNDGREMCTACDRASQPGGFWDFAPAMIPGWKRPEPKFKPKRKKSLGGGGKIQEDMWDGGNDGPYCECCCSEHTFSSCPAREWGTCRGQNSMSRDDEQRWADHYRMTLPEFYDWQRVQDEKRHSQRTRVPSNGTGPDHCSSCYENFVAGDEVYEFEDGGLIIARHHYPRCWS